MRKAQLNYLFCFFALPWPWTFDLFWAWAGSKNELGLPAGGLAPCPGEAPLAAAGAGAGEPRWLTERPGSSGEACRRLLVVRRGGIAGIGMGAV